jgi:unsaturated chondroitin disaccharide hydrolase
LRVLPGPFHPRRTSQAAGRVAALVAAALCATLLTGPAQPAGAAPPEAPAAAAHDQARWAKARAFALHQLAATDRHLARGRYPVTAHPDVPWRTEGSSSWMAGFFPGQLWLAYEATGNPTWAARARARQRDLRWRRFDTSTHDLGFVMLDSFGQASRLTGDPRARRVVLDSAASLASRWVPVAHTLRSWQGPPGQVTVIVDNMVNLELLFWGADHGGPAAWREMALEHALTTRDQLVRPDGSTWHAVRFDEQTGERVWRGNIGGARDDSTWARGQAWAVYGYTVAYRETGDPRMLEVARRTARFALSHLPADGVPYWDYAVPVTRRTPRDSSAGAVLASALLELGAIDPDAGLRARYRRAGLHTLRTLTGPRFSAQGSGSRSVLLHGRASPRTPDAGTVYGDYYLLEALQRAQLVPSTRRALRVVRAGASRAAAHHPGRAVLDHSATSRWSASWRAGAAPAALRLDLGRVRRVSGVSVAFWQGDARATRLRILTSVTGRRWSVARTVVSSGRSSAQETYDVPDRRARFVRLIGLGGSAGRRIDLTTVRVRG